MIGSALEKSPTLDELRIRIGKAFQKGDKEALKLAVKELKQHVPAEELKTFTQELKTLVESYAAFKTAKNIPSEFGLISRNAGDSRTAR